MPRLPKDTSGLGALARNVIRLRHAAGYSTQRALQEATGGVVSQSDVSKIESDALKALSRPKQEALARALGVSVDALYADSDEPTADPSFDAFLKSDFANGITEPEKAELAQTQWAREGAPPAAWYHVLQALRLVRARRSERGEE